jgi:hypothetical protein
MRRRVSRLAIQHLSAGSRILLGSAKPWPGFEHSLKSYVLVERDGDAISLRDDHGEIHKHPLQEGRPTDPLTSEIYWAGPLPTPQTGLFSIAWARLLNSAGRSAVMLHMLRFDGAHATAEFVFPAYAAQSHEGLDHFTNLVSERDKPFEGEIVGSAAFHRQHVLVTLPNGFHARPGDLVGATSIKLEMTPEGVFLAELEAPVILRFFRTREELGEALPTWSVSAVNPFEFGPADDREFDRLLGAARARTEPNEAIVYRFEHDGTHIVAGRGALFFDTGAAEDTLSNHRCAPGLWIVEQATGWSHQCLEGEVDFGIDATWRPATSANVLRFGLTPEQVSQTIAELREIDPLPTLCDEAIDAACAAGGPSPGLTIG